MERINYTEAQKRAMDKYRREKVELIQIHVPKGQRDKIKDHARQQGESMNGFIVRAIDETMQRDNTISEQ